MTNALQKPDVCLFADEAGCFRFDNSAAASKYFILCTVKMKDCAAGAEFLELRRSLYCSGYDCHEKLHATSDKQWVRDHVYELLKQHDFRIDATLLEKRKAQPQTRSKESRFYKYAWYYHLKHLAPTLIPQNQVGLLSAAALDTNRGKAAFRAAVNEVTQQVLHTRTVHVSFPASKADPCLQIADYCTWAIQRKWELGDLRSYDLIKDKIVTEFDLWAPGSIHYY